MEKENKKSLDIIMIILFVLGIVLLVVGLNYNIPSREFSFYSLKKYVGGDAYNAIIESSIRGGEISGAMTSKAIYICSGIITMSLTLLRFKKNN